MDRPSSSDLPETPPAPSAYSHGRLVQTVLFLRIYLQSHLAQQLENQIPGAFVGPVQHSTFASHPHPGINSSWLAAGKITEIILGGEIPTMKFLCVRGEIIRKIFAMYMLSEDYKFKKPAGRSSDLTLNLVVLAQLNEDSSVPREVVTNTARVTCDKIFPDLDWMMALVACAEDRSALLSDHPITKEQAVGLIQELRSSTEYSDEIQRLVFGIGQAFCVETFSSCAAQNRTTSDVMTVAMRYFGDLALASFWPDTDTGEDIARFKAPSPPLTSDTIYATL